MSPRHDPASATELARLGLFGSVAGETLVEVARAMSREEHAAGSQVDAGERFVVLLRGMASAGGAMVRPGGSVGPRAGASLRAVTPITVASCDRQTYEEVVRPLLDAG